MPAQPIANDKYVFNTLSKPLEYTKHQIKWEENYYK